MLDGVPEIPREAVLPIVGMLLAVPTRAVHLEQSVLWAFGLSWKDPEVVRSLTRALISLGYDDVSGRLARQLLTLEPGDPEASEVLEHIRRSSATKDQIIPPVRRPTDTGE
jgi:hypothetical protein